MRTDFKFWFVRRGDGSIVDGREQADGPILEVAVRFYEGDVTTEDKRGEAVTRYRRTARLDPGTLSHARTRPIAIEQSGAKAVVYSAADFGATMDLDDVVAYLKGELAKDETREPIDEQRPTVRDIERVASLRGRR